jgi:hypothetical protein
MALIQHRAMRVWTSWRMPKMIAYAEERSLEPVMEDVNSRLAKCSR